MPKIAKVAKVAKEKNGKVSASKKADKKQPEKKQRFWNNTYERKGTRPLRPGEGGQIGNKNAEKWDLERALELGNELIEWMLPKIEIDKKTGRERDVNFGNVYYKYFLLLNKRVAVQIISVLRKKFKEFDELICHAEEIQKTKLIQYATFAHGNIGGAIFVLKAHHKLYDRPFDEKGDKEDDEKDFSEIAKILKNRLPE